MVYMVEGDRYKVKRRKKIIFLVLIYLENPDKISLMYMLYEFLIESHESPEFVM